MGDLSGLFQEVHLNNARNLLLRNKIVGDSFKQVPDLYWQKILLFGEIISAQNFKLNGNARLYIRYSWETHSEWKLSHEYNESLSTQRTLPFYEEERGIVTAHFGYPFEGCFYSKLQDSLDHPRLFIEVFSVDDWDRHCIQGYSFLRVPNAPGYTTFTIKTWKPLGTHHDQMRSFFIGGTRELADLKYLTIPDDFNGGVYSKYGMMTESSGQVEIRMNTVYQKSTKSRHVQEVVPENKGSHYGSGQLRAISEALLRARVRLDSLKSKK